jgi:hypothetical protein
MKESTLLEMQNKIKSLTNILQHLINENTNLRDLSIGTLETVKLMPGYEDAIKALKAKMEKEIKKNKEERKDGAIEQDTK